MADVTTLYDVTGSAVCDPVVSVGLAWASEYSQRKRQPLQHHCQHWSGGLNVILRPRHQRLTIRVINNVVPGAARFKPASDREKRSLWKCRPSACKVDASLAPGAPSYHTISNGGRCNRSEYLYRSRRSGNYVCRVSSKWPWLSEMWQMFAIVGTRPPHVRCSACACGNDLQNCHARLRHLQFTITRLWVADTSCRRAVAASLSVTKGAAGWRALTAQCSALLPTDQRGMNRNENLDRVDKVLITACYAHGASWRPYPPSHIL